MSDVLYAIRQKYPAYKDVPDEKLIKAVGDKYPQYLDKSEDFKTEYSSLGREPLPSSAPHQEGKVPMFSTGGQFGAIPTPQTFTKTRLTPAQEADIFAKSGTASPVPTIPSIQEAPPGEKEKSFLARLVESAPTIPGTAPMQGLNRIKPEAVPDTAIAAAREAGNLLLSVPKFATSPVGLATAPIAAAAPTLTALGFTGDMLRGLYSEAKDTYKNWDHMTQDQKVVAVEDMIGTGAMAGFLAKHATAGAKKYFSPEEVQKRKEAKENASKVSQAAKVHGDVRTQPGRGQGEVPAEEGGGGVQPPTEAQTKVLLKDRPYVVAHQEETGEFHVGREDESGVVQPEHTFDNQEEADKAAAKANAEMAKMQKTGGKVKKSDVEHVIAHIEKRGGVSAASLAREKKWKRKDPQTKQVSPDIERARNALAEAEKQGLISRENDNEPYKATGKEPEAPADETMPFSMRKNEGAHEEINKVSEMSPREFAGMVPPGKHTQASFDLGSKVTTKDEVEALKDAKAKAEADHKKLIEKADQSRSDKDIQDAASQSSKPQFFEEALEKVPAELKRMSPHDLEPALMINGVPETGGRTHADIAAKQITTGDREKLAGAMEALNKDVNHIFVDKKGRRYTRRQAAEAVGQQGLLHSQVLRGLQESTPDLTTLKQPRASVPHINDAIEPEILKELTDLKRGLGVKMEFVDMMDPNDPMSQKMAGSPGWIAAAQRGTDYILINSREIMPWLREEVHTKDWKEAIRSLVAQERNHLFTTTAHAFEFWRALTPIERKYYQHLYHKGGKGFDNMDVLRWGYEAINLEMQDIAKMTTAEFLSMSRKGRFKSKAMKVLVKVIRAIRKALSKIPGPIGEGARDTLAIQHGILDNIEEKILKSQMAQSGKEIDFSRPKKRAESKDQDTFLLPGSDTIKTGATEKIKTQSGKEITTSAGKAKQFEQVAGEGFKFKPTEAVPESERKVALPAAPAPMTGKQLQDESAKVVDQMFNSAATRQAPKFSDFEEAMRKKQPGIQPGALFDMWQDTVSARLEAASDEDIRNLTKAVLVPKESSTGLRNRWEAMANALLTYSKDPTLKQKSLLPGVTGKEKVAETYKQPKLGQTKAKKEKVPPGSMELGLDIDTSVEKPTHAVGGKKEYDPNEFGANVQEKLDEKAVNRRRSVLKNELFKRMVIPRIEKADLHRNTVSLNDVRWGGGKLIAAVQNFATDAWRNTQRLGEELLDESKRHPSDPNTYTRRLTLIQPKGGKKVFLVSTYRRAGEAMLLDPGHPQKHHLPLREMVGRYRIIQSILLDEPVQKFKQEWDSLQDYQDQFGRDAKETNDQHTSSEGVHGMTHPAETHTAQGQRITQMTGENEGIPGSNVEEGASGHLQGPFRSEIEAATGGARGTLDVNRRAPVTPAEASALTQHLNSELGKAPESPDDVLLVLNDLKAWRRPNPSVVSALRKLAAIVEREQDLRQRQHISEARKEGIKIEPTPLSVDYLKDKLAQYIYEDKNLEKTLADAAKVQSAAPRTAPGVAAPSLDRPSSARELTLPINRRPPTDVIGLPPGTPRPMPEATANPVLHDLLTAPDIEHVERLTRDPSAHAELAKEIEERPYTPSPPVEVTPDDDLILSRRKIPGREQVEHATAELDKKRRQMLGAWGRRQTVKELKQDRDGLDNIGATIREGTKLSLRNVVVTKDEEHDQLIRETPIAMLGALRQGKNPKSGKVFVFYDPKVLERFVRDAEAAGMKADSILNDSKSTMKDRNMGRQWKAASERLLKIATYARDHWQDKEVRDMAQAVRAELADQLYREHSGGVNTTDFGLSYIPSMKEGEFWNLDSVTFGEDPVIGSRFSAKKTFRDHYDAIRAGPFIPKNYDTSITVAHRVGVGMNAINRNAFLESAKGIKDDKTGLPVVVSAIPVDPHQAVREDTGVKEFYHHGWQTHDPRYELVKMGDGQTPVSVLKPYARTWSLLFSKSGFENSVLGEGAIYSSSMLKHGVVLVVDTFHPSRLGQYAAALSHPKDVPGLMRRSFSKKVGAWTALFYRPQDLDLAVQNGLIHPEAAAWAREKILIGNELYTKQQVLHMMVAKGLNASRIGDAMYKDAVERIPIVGRYLFHGLDEPGIRSKAVPEWIRRLNLKNFNGWMFDRLLPSLISETAVRNFEALHRANPGVNSEKLMRDVITDINTVYGNMGRQGIIASPTIRDVAQVFLLAPAWQEGLVGKEVRTLGRLTGISNLTGRRGLPQFGALGRFMGRGLAAYFLLTQFINLLTRRQFTVQNEWPHELDAWIPTGTNTGVWLSPMSIFGETIHDFTRLYETNHNAWKTVKRIGLNKLGPVGRFANVLVSGTSSQGQALTTTGAVIKSALSELAPTPISLGVPVRMAGHMITDWISPPEPGAASRQAFAYAGIKVQAETDNVSQMKNLAMQYVHDNHLRPDEAMIAPTDEPSYSGLRHAVKIGDYRVAGKILDQLQKIHKGDDTPTIQAMNNWVSRPLTGGIQTEREWLSTLNPSEMAQYQKAVDSMQKQYQQFLDWYFKYRNPGPSK